MLTSSAGQPARGIGFVGDTGFSVQRDAKNHHTVQLNLQGGGNSLHQSSGSEQPTLASLPLVQFHFHHPSEHLLDGRRYPMEMHLVHNAEALIRRPGGQQQRAPSVAVVGVFLTVGPNTRPNLESLASLFTESGKGGRPNFPNTTVYDALLPPVESRDYFNYAGSLTTPDCTGDVTWYVMKTPVAVSQTFVDTFQSAFLMNARWPQMLDGRAVANGRPAAVRRLQPFAVPGGR
jgi:carbonic anhydrase